MIKIISNGSKWLGEEPDSIEVLIETLKEYALDPIFEEYGNFVIGATDGGPTRFFGNFLSLSHVFNLETDEPEIIRQLIELIDQNQQRQDYRQARGVKDDEPR